MDDRVFCDANPPPIDRSSPGMIFPREIYAPISTVSPKRSWGVKGSWLRLPGSLASETMSSQSPVHRKFLAESQTSLAACCSKKSRVLENLAAGSVVPTREEFDEINQLVKDLNFHGLQYNQAAEAGLWG